MKAENTPENKAKFFAQYWGQRVLPVKIWGSANDVSYYLFKKKDLFEESYLELTSLSSISDEDAIEVAHLAFLQGRYDWKITRRDDWGVWMESHDNLDIMRYCMINKYGCINTSTTFPEKKHREKKVTYKRNIGEVGSNINDGVSYIRIVDHLRSKGYALPWMGLSIEDLIEYGWVKIKEG